MLHCSFFKALCFYWPTVMQIKLEYDDKNEFTHSYVLVVKPDNTFEVFMDFKSKSKGEKNYKNVFSVLTR